MAVIGDAPPTDREVRHLSFRNKLGRWDVKFSPYLYISPFFLLFAVVGLFPLLYTGYVATQNWPAMSTESLGFVGLDNFQDILGRRTFWLAVRNTFSIFLLSSVPQIMMAIVIAAVLDANIRAKTFWRMGVLLPYIVAPVAVGLIFNKVFAVESGVMNAFLDVFGIGPVQWIYDTFSSHVAIATMVNFRWTGYNTLILLAAMQAIPKDLYEAAVLDGAGRIRQFFSITIPSVRSTLVFVIIISTIGGLQIFDEPMMLDRTGKGGADRQFTTLTTYLYELAWNPNSRPNFGYAGAVAWLLFVIILIFGLLNFFLTSRISSADGTHARLSRRERRARRRAEQGANS